MAAQEQSQRLAGWAGTVFRRVGGSARTGALIEAGNVLVEVELRGRAVRAMCRRLGSLCERYRMQMEVEPAISDCANLASIVVEVPWASDREEAEQVVQTLLEWASVSA